MLLIEFISIVLRKVLLNEKFVCIVISVMLFLFALTVFSTYDTDFKFSFSAQNNNRTMTKTKINAPTLFCFILANPDNFYHKTTAVYKTWATKCDDFRFVSVIPKLYLNEETKYFKLAENQVSIEVDRPFPLLQPAGYQNEDYKKLTDKIYLTLIDIYKRYNKYDWYLKADDDTYIFVDYLREFIANKNASLAHKFGYNLKTWQSGGAGYLLSNRSINEIGSKLISDYRFCPNSGIEDQDIAGCFGKMGIQPSQSIDEQGRQRFHPFNVTTHLFGDYPNWIFGHSEHTVHKGPMCCSDRTISFHYMSVEQIYKINFLYDEYKRNKTSSSGNNFHSILYKMFE